MTTKTRHDLEKEIRNWINANISKIRLINKLRRENEQLKAEQNEVDERIQSWKGKCEFLEKKNKDLEQRFEQLKKKIKDLEPVSLFALYDKGFIDAKTSVLELLEQMKNKKEV